MMAQIWHKLFSFGANFSHLAKVMAQEKKILVGTLKVYFEDCCYTLLSVNDYFQSSPVFYPVVEKFLKGLFFEGLVTLWFIYV